jgi:hypothetical protein
MMVMVVLASVSCGRETPEKTATTPAEPLPSAIKEPAPAPLVSTSVPPAPPAANRSTPQKCAGDGSYDRALDCFRISAGFRFTMGDVKGEMKRPTPGMERVQFKAADGVTWVGEAKSSGVVWSRNGKHDLSPPDVTNRVWQRTTMVLDPQKKEGSAKLAGVETADGDPSNHYHFTNANSGEENDVWVSTKDGRIVKWKAGTTTLELH